MTEQNELFNTIQPLRNVSALTALVDRAHNRPEGLPGMATFYGPSGYGKTSAAVFASLKFGAVVVQMKSTWTRKKLVEEIARELGLRPAKIIADIVDQIAEALAVTNRPLIIDEADFLMRGGAIEIARDIYESSLSGVILIGEEGLPQALRERERVHGRMIDWVAAQPGEASDVDLLARQYCAGIEVAPELRRRVLEGSARSIRRICVNLNAIRELAMTRGLKRVGVEDWGRTEMFTGAPPAPRREIGRLERAAAEKAHGNGRASA